jgi:hypothetical protein
MRDKPRAIWSWAILTAVSLGWASINAEADTPSATPSDLSQLQFLVGRWAITGGRMTLFGASPHGESEITSEVGGGAYFVKDTFTLVGTEG